MKPAPEQIRDAKAPADLVNDILQEIRQRFYDARQNGSKEYYEDHKMLRKAVLYPAVHLHPRGVRLPWHRYQSIFLGILDTIQRKGNTAQIRRVGAYLLHAVQEHMRFHWEEYYAESDRFRTPLDTVIDAIQKIRRKTIPNDPTIEALAAMAAVIPKGGRKKATKSAPPAIQSELF